MGNYSKNPQDAYTDAQAKNYSRVRFQQGKPILDRELNLMGDLAGTERLARKYIGNAVAQGSDAFKITFDDPEHKLPLNDFNIEPGTCLVNGYEVTLAARTTYRTQPNKTRVLPPPLITEQTGAISIYLHVFTREVNAAEDASLGNSEDVGFETALREKVDWEVVVIEHGEEDKVLNSPDYFRLATIGYDPPKYYPEEARVSVATLATVSNRTIKSDSISGFALIDGTVSGPKLLDDAITTKKIANDNVTLSKLKLRAVCNTSFTLASGTSNAIVVCPIDSTRPAGNPRFLFISVTATTGVTGVEWSESIFFGARYMTFRNPGGTPATVYVQALELIN